MKRADRLITRRDFCGLAGCLGLAVVGCNDESTNVIGTGGLDGSGNADASVDPFDAPEGSPDAAGHIDAAGHVDAATMIDASSGPTCTSAAVDAGPPSSFALNAPTLVSAADCFVVRDSGGLYAVSSICTHQGATNNVSSGHFRCPRHGAQFTFNGDIISGPVSRVLVHYATCILPNGNVGVMTGQTVPASTRMPG